MRIPWGDEPPFRAPVFVVTHRPRTTSRARGGTRFTFVTAGSSSTPSRWRAKAAGWQGRRGRRRRHVAAPGPRGAGCSTSSSCTSSPVLLGDGQRLFDADLGLGDGEGIELTPLRVVETPEVTHVRYAVAGRHELVLDDRGSGETAA